jgi:hypothetical protein
MTSIDDQQEQDDNATSTPGGSPTTPAASTDDPQLEVSNLTGLSDGSLDGFASRLGTIDDNQFLDALPDEGVLES